MIYNSDDIVVCLPGFLKKERAFEYTQHPYSNNNEKLSIEMAGGAGYQENLIFKITTVSYNNVVLFGAINNWGVYSSKVRLATEEEIELYNKGYRNIYQLFL